MSRVHPFDYAFGPVADTWFPELRGEAQRAGSDAADQAQFLKLPSVRKALGELPPEEGGTEGFVTLLYSAYRFWDGGKVTCSTTRAALEPELDRPHGDAPAPPENAPYVRLPERWIWSRVHEQSPHEPLDGLFIMGGPRGRDVLVVGVLGLRPDRGGYSQISALGTADDYAAAGRVATPPRFAPAMDGGEQAGFRSVNSNAELLLLASLALTTARE